MARSRGSLWKVYDMLEIRPSKYLDAVYLYNVHIGYIYLHTGINKWVYESTLSREIKHWASERDDVIDYIFVRLVNCD